MFDQTFKIDIPVLLALAAGFSVEKDKFTSKVSIQR